MENTHTHTQERELASACFVKALGVATISRFNEAIIMKEKKKTIRRRSPDCGIEVCRGQVNSCISS